MVWINTQHVSGSCLRLGGISLGLHDGALFVSGELQMKKSQ